MRLDKLALLRSSGRNRSWFIVSAAIHVGFIALAIVLFRPRPPRTVTYIDLGDGVQEQMPAYRGPAGGRPTGRTPTARPRPGLGAPMPPAPAVVAAAPVAPPDTGNAVTAVAEEEDTLPLDTHRELGPQYGDGRLWVRAGDAAAGRVPARMAVDSMPLHVARIDSALAEKIRTYLDTVPPDSFATHAAPKWTTQIAGKTWGIDGKWIYLGGIKIPTAILALLPLPADAAGNYDASMRAQRLELMRRDIMEAAQRATNAVEFKKYVKELRQRKEEERRARDEPPPPPVKPDSAKKTAPTT